ncbi:MAG: GNAT family N-acetyltransferase [Anaerolineae bacterium]
MTALYDFSYFPELTTARLVMDEITREDTSAMFRLFSDERVTRYNDASTFEDMSDAYRLIGFLQERFNARVGVRWAIRLKTQENTLIGTCGFNVWHRHNNCGIIGYDLLPAYWNQGITTEAARAMLNFGFTKMALNRIEADVMTGNEASMRVLMKLGFMREGILRQRGYWKGQYHDLHLFAVLRAEYTTISKT